MVDNLGYGDFGFSGNEKVRTPNIDKFASESIQFTGFYTNPMCAPTRASLMTARYPYRTGVIHTSRGGAKMHGEEITMAEYLNKAGYVTGLFGKWHLGDNYPMRPYDQGFSQALYFKSGRIGQVPDAPNTYFDPVLYLNGEKIKTKGYCTDVFTDAAIDFIEENREKTFLVYLPYNAAHRAEEEEVGPLVSAEYSNFYKEMGCDDEIADLYGMATNVDDNFKRLLDKLEELDIRDNTIIIFTSEDGPGHEYNAGLRTGEGDELANCEAGGVYQADLRVPFLIQWKERFKGPEKIDQIASHIDILPTILEACGQDISEDHHFDGISLMPLLTGNTEEWKDRMLFFQCHRGLNPKRYQNCAVITRDYKMVGYPNTFNEEDLQVSFDNPYLELYNLINDPREKNDISADDPETLRMFKIAYDKWYDEMKNTRDFKPGMIYLGSELENPVHLSRYQDGAYHHGLPTGWPVVVEHGGKYEIQINRESNVEGTLYVQIDNDLVSRPLQEGENSSVFYLPKGEFKINVWVQGKGMLFHIPRSVEDIVGDVVVSRK